MPRTRRGGALLGRATPVRERELSSRFVVSAQLAIAAVMLIGFVGAYGLEDGLFPYAGTALLSQTGRDALEGHAAALRRIIEESQRAATRHEGRESWAAPDPAPTQKALLTCVFAGQESSHRVEPRRVELLTSAMQRRRSTN